MSFYYIFLFLFFLTHKGSWHPSSLNISYSNYAYPQAVFFFSDFSTHLTRIDESMWAPVSHSVLMRGWFSK